MKIDMVYLDDVDCFEVTIEDYQIPAATFKVRNAQLLRMLISALTLATDHGSEGPWELHIKHTDWEDDPKSWQHSH